MGCMCNKKEQVANNQESIENKKPQENINNLNKKPQENINNLNKKPQENINNKTFKKENFFDINDFLSKNWLYIVVGILVLIGLLYVLFLRQNNYREFILAPPSHIRGRLDDYNVEL